MEIIADHVSKIYDYNRVINDFSHHFRNNSCCGISGSNGSGKSTLLKILSGFLTPSNGTITFVENGKSLKRNQIYKEISIAAPYATPLLDFDLKENFELIKKFKNITHVSYQQLLSALEWKDPKTKHLKYFSSGMLQRVNVCLATMLSTSVVFLDEPTSFLDEKSKEWFKNLLGTYKSDKLIIISSNDNSDFFHCSEIVPVKL